MGQVSSKLRRTTQGYAHWCPGCGELHVIFDRWQFSGDLERPTFSPSVKITGKKIIRDTEGRWTGEWAKGPDGKAVDECCHYFLRNGQLEFCGDSTHALKGQIVDLPDLPTFLRDDDFE